jgi:hypothetical protein
MRWVVIFLITLLVSSTAACSEIQSLATYKDTIIDKVASLSSQVVTRQVGTNSDDCMRYWNGSSWSWQQDSTYHTVGHQTPSATKHGIGLRFTNITVPNSAKITQANIKVVSRSDCSNTVVRSRISGEDVDDAVAFTTQSDFEGRFQNRTKATVDWDSIGEWTTDAEYTSPDIGSIIQQIVNRPGWESGSAIVIFWEDFEGRSDTVTDYVDRRSYSYDANPAKAVTLYVAWRGPTDEMQSLPKATEEQPTADAENYADNEGHAGIGEKELYLVPTMAASNQTMTLRTVKSWTGNRSIKIKYEATQSPWVVNCGYTPTSQIASTFSLFVCKEHGSYRECQATFQATWGPMRGTESVIIQETGDFTIDVEASGCEWWAKVGVE